MPRARLPGGWTIPTSVVALPIRAGQRLANGNTLICSYGQKRRHAQAFRGHPGQEVVWEYFNPAVRAHEFTLVSTNGKPRVFSSKALHFLFTLKSVFPSSGSWFLGWACLPKSVSVEGGAAPRFQGVLRLWEGFGHPRKKNSSFRKRSPHAEELEALDS